MEAWPGIFAVGYIIGLLTGSWITLRAYKNTENSSGDFSQDG